MLPTFAAFAAVTLTSSESLQSSGALTLRASRYAAFTADVASIRGGVPSNITSALSLPRGSADPSNPRLGSVNVAGGSAVTFSSPSAKPCVLRTTKLASHALPDPTTNPGRTRTPPTRISGLSMARPASTRIVSASPIFASLYAVGRSTDPSVERTSESAGLLLVVLSVVICPYVFMSCTSYAPDAASDPRPETTKKYSEFRSAVKVISPHALAENAPHATCLYPPKGGYPSRALAAFSARTVAPKSVTALAPAGAANKTFTTSPAAKPASGSVAKPDSPTVAAGTGSANVPTLTVEPPAPTT